MVRGIYTGVAGMIPRLNQQRNIASNLANQTTNGFKKTDIFLRTLITAQWALDHATGVERTEVPEDIRIDYSQGALDQTEMPFDLALMGRGFLQVSDANGNVYATRGGRFYLDEGGFVITSSGMNLLDSRGQPVRVQGSEAVIFGNGDVYEDDVYTGSVGIIDFAAADYQSLNSIGGGLFLAPAGVGTVPRGGETRVMQGYLENANVDSIVSMVDMIEVLRMFEVGQKSIQAQDESLQRVVTDLGMVR